MFMQYSNGNWGPNQIDRLFAHETGHVFNAPDEYQYYDCRWFKKYGNDTCSDMNDNCKNCTTSQTKCIMEFNDFNLYSYTKKHVGWCS